MREDQVTGTNSLLTLTAGGGTRQITTAARIVIACSSGAGPALSMTRLYIQEIARSLARLAQWLSIGGPHMI